MNYYKCSNGERIAKSVIDYRVREAKKKKLADQFEEFGYNFCQEKNCGASSGVYLDCSHDISVDKCQKSGRSELAWDIDNITIRCRKHHIEHD